jgi:hypothetical protein
MPRGGATFDENRSVASNLSLSPLPRGTPRFVRQGVRERPPLDPLLAKKGKSFSKAACFLKKARNRPRRYRELSNDDGSRWRAVAPVHLLELFEAFDTIC